MKEAGRIPLVDLAANYRAHRAELDQAVAACLESTSFIGGKDHAGFMAEFAAFCGVGHAALCGNGTDALVLALRELLGPGDGAGEVITASHTFIATAEAITLAGYRPVFVDIREDTCVMDVDALEAAIGPRTRAILPVHLYGQMVPMDRVMEVARRRGLEVIEDAAQAHGALWAGRGPGALGGAACFSFYPGKNLGAWGDGGAVVSNDEGLIKRIRMRLDHGRTSKYLHERAGTNSRLDGLQASVLRVKLRHLAAWNARRRELAALYDQLLPRSIQRLTVAPQATSVHHLYVVQVDRRDAVVEALKKRGIDAGVHYPVPVHEQPARADLGAAPCELPVTSRVARRVLSLPMYPELTREQVERVVAALVEAIGAAAGATA